MNKFQHREWGGFKLYPKKEEGVLFVLLYNINDIIRQKINTISISNAERNVPCNAAICKMIFSINIYGIAKNSI